MDTDAHRFRMGIVGCNGVLWLGAQRFGHLSAWRICRRWTPIHADYEWVALEGVARFGLEYVGEGGAEFSIEVGGYEYYGY